jgi:hypothetical protein
VFFYYLKKFISLNVKTYKIETGFFVSFREVEDIREPIHRHRVREKGRKRESSSIRREKGGRCPEVILKNDSLAEEK